MNIYAKSKKIADDYIENLNLDNIACFVKDQLKSNCIIERCGSDEYKRAAEVAKNSCLDCNKIKQYININESWQEDVLKVLNC